MPTKEISVTVENQLLKISNLDKLLFPQTGIIKAELIQYYQRIAPYILPHLINRPLTLIRFPDGIDKIKFYAKNKPDWTPNWINSIKLPDNQEIEYLVANNTADLVYLANLAAIELHSMTLRSNNFLPDVFIFDLDPPEGIDFEEIKKIAFDLKQFLEEKKYMPYLKTSGSKGLHIYVPIKPIYTTEEVVENAKNLSKEFILTHPNTTLLISKERRTNKILIDIYRNHRSQTCASAYSVRAKEGAPVSTPIGWESLHTLKSSQQYNIRNIFEYLEKTGGDPWRSIYETSANLHNEIKQEFNFDQKNTPTDPVVPPDTSNLLAYSQKRNFQNTPEPSAEIILNKTGILRYVIHKHNASNLHYDLRLEYDGVLLSWAIPKALPTKPDEKRLAIQTEPHPMKYIDFEGIIPKDEYGGGEMWVFDTGEFSFLKKDESKIRFVLRKGKIVGEFYIYHTDGNKWLIERKENGKQIDAVSVQPMLADLCQKIPSIENHFFEIKWDGIRVIIQKDGENIKLLSKSGRDITEKFPEVVKQVLEFKAQSAVIDGEIVALDTLGIPNFAKIISRLHLTGNSPIEKASQSNKATCYLFDLIYLDGQDLRNMPIEKRRKWLNISFDDSQSLRFSQGFDDGAALFDAIKLQNMEGIIAKKKGSIYQSNTRNGDWQKVKVKNAEDAIIVGYTKGKGERALLFGSLILGQYDNGKLIYKGRVGTGFDEKKLKNILRILSEIPRSKKLISESIDEENMAIWLEPKLWCEVQFASLTGNNTFREPVFVKMKEIDEL